MKTVTSKDGTTIAGDAATAPIHIGGSAALDAQGNAGIYLDSETACENTPPNKRKAR